MDEDTKISSRVENRSIAIADSNETNSTTGRCYIHDSGHVLPIIIALIDEDTGTESDTEVEETKDVDAILAEFEEEKPHQGFFRKKKRRTSDQEDESKDEQPGSSQSQKKKKKKRGIAKQLEKLVPQVIKSATTNMNDSTAELKQILQNAAPMFPKVEGPVTPFYEFLNESKNVMKSVRDTSDAARETITFAAKVVICLLAGIIFAVAVRIIFC